MALASEDTYDHDVYDDNDDYGDCDEVKMKVLAITNESETRNESETEKVKEII